VCRESGEEIMEAAAGIMFAARWCGDLPELLLARTILEHKFGSDFAATAKEGAGMVDPMVSDSIVLALIICTSELFGIGKIDC
jgi:predicted nicotinamide N-methyase